MLPCHSVSRDASRGHGSTKFRVSSAGPPLGIGTAHFRLVLEDAVTDFNKIQRVMQHMAASGGSQQSFTETQLRSQVCSCSPTNLCRCVLKIMDECHVISSEMQLLNMNQQSCLIFASVTGIACRGNSQISL